MVDNPASDADAAAAVALAAARYGDDPVYRVVPTRAEFDSIDLATMKRVWAERFGGANDWVFVFSGDFDRDKVVELARRYIGTLPGGGPVERWIDHQPDPPATVVETEVVAGTGQHAGLTQLYTATSDGSVSDRVQADLLSIILSSRLTDHVREQLGATYSPSASASIVTEPDDIVETYVDVSGAPDGLAKLSEVVRADIADLAGHGPTAADLSEAKAQLKQKYQYFDNGTWVDVLLGGVDDNNVIADYLDQPSVLGDITVESAVAFAARVLPTDHFIEVRVRPG